jgi:glycosyltransferase involved in cell wall biosynthesis
MKVILSHEHGRNYGSGGMMAVWRLHQGLQRIGVESILACRNRDLDDPTVVELPRAPLQEKIIGRITWELGINDVHGVSAFKIPRHFAPFKDADVLNLQGLHSNFFSYLALPKLSRLKPLVLGLHDMWHLTGHCATTPDCDRWKIGCGQCPHLDAFPPIKRDGSRWDFKLKHRTYKRIKNLMFVGVSTFIIEQARQGMLADAEFRQIPNAIDTDLYAPMDKREARAKLNLPPDRPILMFGAMGLDNPIKGADLLIESLNKLDDDLRTRALIVLIGDGGEQLAEAIGIEAVSLGYVRDDATKIAAFSAADIFLSSSRWEVQGIVLIEAMACGTCCIGFDIGGIGEVIRSGPSGLVVPAEDTEAYAHAITTLLRDDALRARSIEQGRAAAVREYDWLVQAQRYKHVYEEAIERWHAPAGG